MLNMVILKQYTFSRNSELCMEIGYQAKRISNYKIKSELKWNV